MNECSFVGFFLYLCARNNKVTFMNVEVKKDLIRNSYEIVKAKYTKKK